MVGVLPVVTAVALVLSPWLGVQAPLQAEALLRVLSQVQALLVTVVQAVVAVLPSVGVLSVVIQLVVVVQLRDHLLVVVYL